MDQCSKLIIMLLFLNFVLTCIFTRATADSDTSSTKDQKTCFPGVFSFGVSSAAYQIEGAWQESGKGESIWDRYTHTHPERILDESNADIADDSFHQLKEDVRLLAELKVHFYRFSISWSRILPNGLRYTINKEGIMYYHKLIDELYKRGINPVVTMYHWDLPQSLEDMGGWTNPIMADVFLDYARVLFDTFGDKVKHWITFNDPFVFCREGYGTGLNAPGINNNENRDYQCGHNVLRAHGKVYRLYEQEYKHKYTGTIRRTIGISLSLPWLYPKERGKDEYATEIAQQYMFGWFAHPIFSREGNYPEIMRNRLLIGEGFVKPLLPKFTEEELVMIQGSADYLGLNYDSVYSISKKGMSPVDFDMGISIHKRRKWSKTSITEPVYPRGLRNVLQYIKYNYSNIAVIITENGISLPQGLNDVSRMHYIIQSLASVRSAIYEDGCNVMGYTYKSLIDGFEWSKGYTERFGLYEVDYKSPNRTRTPRLSAARYSKIITTGCLD